MTINNADLYLGGIWDWACLDGCFGDTMIKPTDIDGLVERKGKFLFIETKRDGVPIPTGQEITYRGLIRTGAFTILVIWGDNGDPKRIRLITPKIEKYYENTNLDQLRRIVGQWFQYAENSGR